MSRHIATYIHPFTSTIFFSVSEYLLQSMIIQLVFQLIRQIGIIRRFMLRLPIKTIIFLPFPFESLAVSTTCPEFGLFHIDGINACINGLLYMCFFYIGQIILCRNNVGHLMSVPDSISFLPHLSFVHVRYSVPFSGKIALIFSPGDPCHEMSGISAIAPGVYTLCKRYGTRFVGRISIDSIYDGDISSVIQCRTPRLRCLKHRLLFGMLCNTTYTTEREYTKQNKTTFQYHNFLFKVGLPSVLLPGQTAVIHLF